jgi:NAD(P)-dependent dehydrogenase (short-subunit alcohol dehydrogenase family)
MPVAIVTGGNSGIGRATAVELAASGFDVGITWHREEERLQSLRQEIQGVGRRFAATHLDLHDLARAAQAVEELADELGGLDALVNNAGYGSQTPILEMELAEWQGVVAVNLTGSFVCAQTAAKRFVAAGQPGRIVNVTSVHEHIPLEGSGPYTASKHGLGGLTKVMALELGKHGITVNAVAPGQIATRMTGQEDQEPNPSDGIPVGRAGKAEEVAAVIAFLCSREASYVTGASYVVDGGLMLTAAQEQ